MMGSFLLRVEWSRKRCPLRKTSYFLDQLWLQLTHLISSKNSFSSPSLKLILSIPTSFIIPYFVITKRKTEKKKMGVIKVSQSFRTKVTPNRMFNALILDSHNLAPQLMFSSIKSIEFLQGNGEPGTIKQLNFTEGTCLCSIWWWWE